LVEAADSSTPQFESQYPLVFLTASNNLYKLICAIKLSLAAIECLPAMITARIDDYFEKFKLSTIELPCNRTCEALA
jgi:hypothetical protein